MRRKIIYAIVFFSVMFLVGGAYILGSIYSSSRSLDRLIFLHQVQNLRGNLLGQVQTVQLALETEETPLADDGSSLIENVQRMSEAMRGCFGCHHSGLSESKLIALQDYVGRYQETLSRVLIVRASLDGSARERNVALRTGDQLVGMLAELVDMASRHLEEKTRVSLARINRANIFLSGLICLGPLAVILMGIFFLHSIHRPLETLLDATRRLKAGDMEARVEVEGLDDEFKEVGDAFNDMVGALDQQMRQMQHTEQLAVCGQLAAGIAHEIKNPLAGIKLTLTILGNELKLGEDDRDLFAKIQQEAGRIETLMKDLLSYARPRDPVPSQLDVNELLDRAGFFGLQRLPSSKGGRGGVDLRKELNPDLPRIVGDRDQLLQVFLNVVLNGVDAMRDGGALTLRTRQEDRFVIVEICDQGPGVPDELKEKIFEPFFTKKAKGTGLGLAVTSRLVEQQGGTIRVEDAPGGGACFAIRLPIEDEEA